MRRINLFVMLVACISLAPESAQQTLAEIAQYQRAQRHKFEVVCNFGGEKIPSKIGCGIGRESYDTTGAPLPGHMPRILLIRGDGKQRVICDSATNIALIRTNPLVDPLLKFQRGQMGADEFQKKIQEIITDEFPDMIDAWKIILSKSGLINLQIKQSYLRSKPLARVREFISEYLYGNEQNPELILHKFEITGPEEDRLLKSIAEEFGLPDEEVLSSFQSSLEG